MKKHYKTKQKTKILQAISEYKQAEFTARELHSYLQKEGEKVSLATVYRQIPVLLEEGHIQQINKAGSEQLFAYIVHPETCHKHFHFKCQHCSDYIHLDCKLASTISEHLLKEHGCKVDWLESVLYGTCANCEISN